MGLDLSKNKPGVTVYDTTNKQIIFCDSIKIPTSVEFETTDYFEFVQHILLDIFNEFQMHKIIIEEIFISPLTVKSNIPLIKLNSYVGMFFREKGLQIYKVLPSTSRAHLKIKPNKKEQAFEWIKERYPEIKLENFKKDNDKSDSLILALNHDNKDLQRW